MNNDEIKHKVLKDLQYFNKQIVAGMQEAWSIEQRTMHVIHDLQELKKTNPELFHVLREAFKSFGP